MEAVNSPERASRFHLGIVATISIFIGLILIGLTFVVAGRIRPGRGRARVEAEIIALEVACESYKADHGFYPQNPSATDTLDPRTAFDPASGGYAASTKFLYQQLTGDENCNGKIDAGETARDYAADLFKHIRLGGAKVNGVVTQVTCIQDPFGNPYGYSTAGLAAEQAYRQAVAGGIANQKDPAAGYNSTFDLWSTGGGKTNSASDTAKWAKNW